VTVETERTQSLIGFVKAHGKALRNLSADLKNEFASIVLASMDAEPLSRSEKMLLTAGSRVANTGMQWNETRTGLARQGQGGPPSLIEPVAGTITLRNLDGATAVTVTAMDGAGCPIGAGVRARKSSAGWTFPAGDPVTTWYVIHVAH
jgi:hypothetical protein